jgi:hypothetical protein
MMRNFSKTFLRARRALEFSHAAWVGSGHHVMSAFTAGLPARICSSIPSPMSVKENAAQKKGAAQCQ